MAQTTEGIEIRLVRLLDSYPPIIGASGYKGRIGLHELLVATPEIKKLIQHPATVEEMLNLAITQGMRNLNQDGIEKILQGYIYIQQVRAV